MPDNFKLYLGHFEYYVMSTDYVLNHKKKVDFLLILGNRHIQAYGTNCDLSSLDCDANVCTISLSVFSAIWISLCVHFQVAIFGLGDGLCYSLVFQALLYHLLHAQLRVLQSSSTYTTLWYSSLSLSSLIRPHSQSFFSSLIFAISITLLNFLKPLFHILWSKSLGFNLPVFYILLITEFAFGAKQQGDSKKSKQQGSPLCSQDHDFSVKKKKKMLDGVLSILSHWGLSLNMNFKGNKHANHEITLFAFFL